uniref:DUF1731 domain-containing protein n=1 Tax=Mesocestoides corti TaxID=53468 RepID=A0A5K3F4C7_MESCO
FRLTKVVLGFFCVYVANVGGCFFLYPETFVPRLYVPSSKNGRCPPIFWVVACSFNNLFHIRVLLSENLKVIFDHLHTFLFRFSLRLL